MTIRALLIASILALLAPGSLHALTLSADLDTGDCFSTKADDCVGGLYTLEVASVGVNTYEAKLTMFFGGSYDLDTLGTHVSHVEFKVANTYFDPIDVTGAPDAIGNWVPEAGPLNGNGCGGNGGSFICLDATTDYLIVGDTHEWTVEFGSDALLDESAWHIGARFPWTSVNPKGKVMEKANLLSAHSGGSAVPEPTGALLFVAGLAITSRAARGRLRS